MGNEFYLDRVNVEPLIEKISNGILNEYKGLIAIDGPKNSGKSFLIESVASTLFKKGYYHIAFNFDKFNKSENLLNDFLGFLILELKTISDLKIFETFLKEQNIKKIIKQKNKNYNDVYSYKFIFYKKIKESDQVSYELILEEILFEFNKLLKRFSLKVVLTIDNLYYLDLEELYEWQELLETLSLNLKNINMICSIDSEFLTKKSKEIIIEKNIFKQFYDIKKEIKTYDHNNEMIKNFIKEKNIYDLSLIKKIDKELTVFAQVIEKKYTFHVKTDDKKNYYQEICFMFWILKFYKIKNYENFDLLYDYFKVWTDIKRGNKTLEITKYQNFNKIIINLREEDYQFTANIREAEVIDIIQKGLKAKIPVLFAFYNNDSINILNEYFLFFFFNANIVSIDNFYKTKKALCYRIDEKSLNSAVYEVFKKLRIREIEELENNYQKNTFDNEMYLIIKSILEII
ncbi:ATP-binding protein [Spiroplasma tabanidicola]|uniref:ATP-binding protein n=2 Tax=Spiroplasma tabanidicola TaxID=324079 RepID=A0A6I6CAS1_9MOLU|nr:ATP-binding protein [Spiroplasma tabanidicola]